MTNMNNNVKKSLEHQEALIKHIKNTDGVYHDHHGLLVTYIATNIELLKFKYKDLSSHQANLAMHKEIKEAGIKVKNYKVIDKYLFKHRVYDNKKIMSIMFYFNMIMSGIYEFILPLFGYIHTQKLTFIVSIGCMIIFSLISAYATTVLFANLKFKFYSIPSYEDIIKDK